MRVSASEPFQLIYSIFAHEYLGYLFESFVVKKDSRGNLTLTHQNISHKNAKEFEAGLAENDYEIIKLMDSIQQDVITKKFSAKHLKPEEFLPKIYAKEKGDKLIQEAIDQHIDTIKAKILPLLVGKEVYVMSNNGDPAGKKVKMIPEKAKVLFHFFRNESNTHYFPTVRLRGEKIEFQYNGSQIICKSPAWLLVKEEMLLTFDKNVEGTKLKPFLNKRFIEIPKKVEDTYYKTFVTPLVANFDVFAKGFTINSEDYVPLPVLSFKELTEAQSTMSLFDNDKKSNPNLEIGRMVFDLSFQYGEYTFSSAAEPVNSVKLEYIDDNYIFHKVKRHVAWEKDIVKYLLDNNLTIKNGKAVLDKIEAFSWLAKHQDHLVEEKKFVMQQSVTSGGKRYFVGKTSITIEIKENNDWFDIYAEVQFGVFKIPFLKLRNLIIRRKTEFELPNGEIAIIPKEWLAQYSELFNFSEDDDDNIKLKKHHLALVQSLEEGSLAQVSMDRKLQKLKDFDHIEDYPLPEGFNGTLRPYQQAGYNWMRFLQTYNFGGCLADDMGLGKTIQTLCMLQDQKEKGAGTSLLAMPTSLVYNWELEARKFTPNLKVLVYTGTYRDKNVERFSEYDIVITSYGIVRIDIDLMSKFYFNYIILDESQNIKNPTSNISMAVKDLSSKFKLILTGTPIENSTLDLWSQMSFVNPGLLGTQVFFKNFYLNGIEKKFDPEVKKKLYAVIKPFILRRVKEQVLDDLPPKIEQIWYSQMTDEQEKRYEEIKSHYRNIILNEIEEKGVSKSQFTILQGLSQLRQIANHPQMVDPDYKGDSGKMDDVLDMLNTTIEGGHKILIFSQFVKHLTILKNHLLKNKIDFTYLDGATKNRQEQVEIFQNDETIKVFLISLKAGGLGLNLTAANYVFILDPWWNPAAESQAVDRAYRMGQKNTVNTYKFITKDTVEEKILALQNRKKQLASELISTEESFVKTLTKEDIQDILA